MKIPSKTRKYWNFRKAESGFTIIEALVGLVLLSVVIGVNMSWVSSSVAMRRQQREDQDFRNDFSVLVAKIEENSTCNRIFKSLGGLYFDPSSLVKPKDLTAIYYPGLPQPLIQVGRADWNGQLVFNRIWIQLAQPTQLPRLHQPSEYFWLNLEYEIHDPEKKTLKMKSSKQILYQIGLDDATGKFVVDSCTDYITRRDSEISRTICIFFNAPLSPYATTCSLFNNHDLRQTACELSGYSYGGRYCDYSK